jgi:hypothetical protein
MDYQLTILTSSGTRFAEVLKIDSNSVVWWGELTVVNLQDIVGIDVARHVTRYVNIYEEHTIMHLILLLPIYT